MGRHSDGAKVGGGGTVEMKPPELNIVPDAKSRSLADLQQEYGDKLRIASDPDAIYAAITGSHIRVSFLDFFSKSSA